MNKTVLAVIALAVIVAVAGFLFYDGTASDQTVIEKADQTSPPTVPAPAAPAAP